MKKARLYLSPMEREYISIYRELPETTLQKNPVNGSDILEKRMDDIWKRMKENHNQSNVSELEKEGCPWAT